MTKILVIEDETGYQQILKETFEKKGFRIAIATDVKQATADVEIDRPDIILLDIILPGGMNGFDFLEKLKSKKTTSNIPVIVLTNLDSEEKVAKEVGASFYFIKANTKIEEIFKKVKEILHIDI